MASIAASNATYILQAELQFLLVRHEIASHLHRQVVERQNAVKKRQHLSDQIQSDILQTKEQLT